MDEDEEFRNLVNEAMPAEIATYITSGIGFWANIQ